LKEEHEELTDERDSLKEDLAKEQGKSLMLLSDRRKASDALQDAKRKIAEQAEAAQKSIAALTQEARRLQALQGKSQAKALQDKSQILKLTQQAEDRFQRTKAMHQQNVDLQRKHEALSTDFRRARIDAKETVTKHQADLQRQSKELGRVHKV
jgi:hypothetical protein